MEVRMIQPESSYFDIQTISGGQLRLRDHLPISTEFWPLWSSVVRMNLRGSPLCLHINECVRMGVAVGRHKVPFSGSTQICS